VTSFEIGTVVLMENCDFATCGAISTDRSPNDGFGRMDCSLRPCSACGFHPAGWRAVVRCCDSGDQRVTLMLNHIVCAAWKQHGDSAPFGAVCPGPSSSCVRGVRDRVSSQSSQDCFGLPSKIWVISQVDIRPFNNIRKEWVMSQQGIKLAE
jgi:hypothetical protein